LHRPPACCSNRSAALLSLHKVSKALSDAEECIRMRPDWDKGHFRKAAALEVMERTEEVGAGGWWGAVLAAGAGRGWVIGICMLPSWA